MNDGEPVKRTLVELCDPLFHYLCELNRSAREGKTTGVDEVKSQLERVLDEIRSDALAHELTDAFEKIYPDLVYFVDKTIATSNDTNLGNAWAATPLAKEKLRGIANGDRQFFDDLDALLARKDVYGASSIERLKVFYVCMGLGMSRVSHTADDLRRLMQKISEQLKGETNGNLKQSLREQICPEAYNPDSRDLTRKSAPPLIGLLIAVIFFVVGVVAWNFIAYPLGARELQETLRIVGNAAPAKPSTLPS